MWFIWHHVWMAAENSPNETEQDRESAILFPTIKAKISFGRARVFQSSFGNKQGRYSWPEGRPLTWYRFSCDTLDTPSRPSTQFSELDRTCAVPEPGRKSKGPQGGQCMLVGAWLYISRAKQSGPTQWSVRQESGGFVRKLISYRANFGMS